MSVSTHDVISSGMNVEPFGFGHPNDSGITESSQFLPTHCASPGYRHFRNCLPDTPMINRHSNPSLSSLLNSLRKLTITYGVSHECPCDSCIRIYPCTWLRMYYCEPPSLKCSISISDERIISCCAISFPPSI